jgi:hypothetical protein
MTPPFTLQVLCLVCFFLTTQKSSAPIQEISESPARGSVYNPFDPSARIPLDFRGKAPCTKFQEPQTGKIFIVP